MNIKNLLATSTDVAERRHAHRPPKLRSIVLMGLLVGVILISPSMASVYQPEDDTTNAATQPFTLDASLKELNDISRSLRGSGSNDVDSAGIISKVKDVATSYLASIETIQGHFHDGNMEEVGAAMKAAVGDTDALIQAKLGSDIGFPQSFDGIASSDAHPLALSDIPDAQLAEFVKPET